MKFLVTFLVLGMVATALARPDEATRAAIKEGIDRLKAAHEKCQKDPATAIPERPENSEPPSGPPAGPPPPNQAAHALCISKNTGLQNEDGSINKALIESRARAAGSDNIQAINEECLVAQETPEATAQKLMKCLQKHAPKPPKPQN